MSKVQTDNSFLNEKVKLRVQFTEHLEELHVLDLYHGDGVIWDKVSKETGKRINILGIDKKFKTPSVLKGDNIKFISSVDLDKFNIIDCDAYGVPFRQLKALFNKRTTVIHQYFVTFIQSGMGNLPHEMLYEYGYTKKMINKIPTLFTKKGMEVIKGYLANNGVREINHIERDRKHYFHFEK